MCKQTLERWCGIPVEDRKQTLKRWSWGGGGCLQNRVNQYLMAREGGVPISEGNLPQRPCKQSFKC